jgi:hypothetical protein
MAAFPYRSSELVGFLVAIFILISSDDVMDDVKVGCDDGQAVLKG